MRTIILIAIALLLATVNAAISPVSVNNYCTGGTTNWAFNQLTSGGTGEAALLDFNHVSAYRSQTTGDSVEIFVRDSVTTTPFTFITFDKATLAKTEKICTGATADAKYTFVKLINNFLFLQSSGPTKYWVYPFNQNLQTVTAIQLSAPSGTLPNAIVNFIPFFAAKITSSNVQIYVVFTDDTKSAVYYYSWGSMVSASVAASLAAGNVFNYQLTPSVFGNDFYIFDPILKKVQLNPDGVYADYTDKSLAYPSDLTLVKGYNLRLKFFVLSLLTDSTARGGELYVVNGFTMNSKVSWTSATTVAYRDFTDEVSNFIRWGDDNTLWLTITVSGSSTIQTTIASADLVVAGQTIQDIALSADKAIIFYTTTIKYLKHVSDGVVKSLFTKTGVTTGNMDLTKSEYQYKIGFSCLCSVIKRFACFSSTLNCLIVKKGSSTCAGTQNFVGSSGGA